MAFPLAPGATQLSRETKRFECKRKGKYFLFWHEELTGIPGKLTQNRATNPEKAGSRRLGGYEVLIPSPHALSVTLFSVIGRTYRSYSKAANFGPKTEPVLFQMPGTIRINGLEIQNSGKDNSILWLPKDRAPDETDGLLSGDKLSHFPSSMAPVQKASRVPQLAYLANQGSVYSCRLQKLRLIKTLLSAEKACCVEPGFTVRLLEPKRISGIPSCGLCGAVNEFLTVPGPLSVTQHLPWAHLSDESF
ncbi:hypothetical protein E5288_WYG014074 [Bos mutus]|uniref:Uncharacterized protein n=1 Tax=Bos mutus TaxID=72004 RepID=A0A6B0RN31_9CETA|nr:hypothetical protein [Bos mutus]